MPTRFTTLDQLSSDAVQYDAVGVMGTVPAGTTGNIDLPVDVASVVMGGLCIVKGANWGDKANLQLVYGDTVVAQYVSNFYMCEDRQFQFEISTSFPANIPAGLKLRCAYTSTGSTDVQVAINYKLARVIA